MAFFLSTSNSHPRTHTPLSLCSLRLHPEVSCARGTFCGTNSHCICLYLQCHYLNLYFCLMSHGPHSRCGLCTQQDFSSPNDSCCPAYSLTISLSLSSPLLPLMADTGAPPVIPTELQQYNSYVEDPKWQIKFTIAWTSALAVFVLIALPAILSTRRKWASEVFGVSEDWRGRYTRLDDKPTEELDTPEKERKSCCGRVHSISELQQVPQRRNSHVILARVLSALGSVIYWTPPGIGLNAGQILLITAYSSTVLACICTSAPLLSNSNRAGFLALAQLPPVFLLASKNTPLSLLLPPFFAYTRLNALHRWAGRTMGLAALVHGALWIRNHLEWDMPILGQQKEGSGVAALGVMGVIVVSSLRPVRVWAWGVFYWVHFLAVPAFFITVCYHTIYAAPWIFPPIAIYAFDILMRAGRFRLKDAQLIRVDNQMTLIHIPDCDAGFRAGQHLRVRVFFGGRAFEAHPLSVMCAPSASGSETTCLSAGDVAGPGVLLGARVVGDWTRALNEYAAKQEEEAFKETESTSAEGEGEEGPSSSGLIAVPRNRKPVPIPVQVMFDGPYGGCSLKLGEYERVLLVAGGSGATFAVGLMDSIVAAAARTGKTRSVKTRTVHFVWCTRSFGSIKWFAPLLRALALAASAPGSMVALRMTVYVTCMCSPEEVGIPGLEVRVGGRPEMGRLVRGMAGLCLDDDDVGGKSVGGSEEELCGCGCLGGRLAVCASGPEGLTREAANAVAGCKARGREVGLHTEVFAV
ncbi:hypothetical protein FPV67DRAFT_1588099 [Lyophyllum atratum]|nr:hypothetical protein FPV67DRAFT_1588099 [Lyophyllum atratum]